MLRLEKVNGKNVWDILKLGVKEEQMNFVADNSRSIIEAYVAIAGGAMYFLSEFMTVMCWWAF